MGQGQLPIGGDNVTPGEGTIVAIVGYIVIAMIVAMIKRRINK